MYRDNEASRVREVLSCKLAGDTAGLVAAAVRVWILPAEANAESEGATAEVWAALVESAAVPKAVDAVMKLARDRQVIRPVAFIDIVENIADTAVLIELSTCALAAGWPAHPYLVAIFLRLVELQQETALWDHIKKNRERLRADTGSWTLVGFILTTTRIGDRHDVADWFHDLDQRTNVPSWVVAAYAASIFQLPGDHLPQLGKIARVARNIVPDDTGLFILMLRLIDELCCGQDAEFLAEIEGHLSAITNAATAAILTSAMLDHPIVQYVNSAKRTPIKLNEFEGPMTRPPHWRLIALVKELQHQTSDCARFLPLFKMMIELQRGDAKVIDVYSEMQRARPKEFPGVRNAWARLVKERIPWLTRLKLEYF